MWTVQSWYDESRKQAEAGAPGIAKMADFFLKMYQENLPGKSIDEVGRLLKACNEERIDSVPDLRKYPELRGMKEMISASWRGVRDGAKLNDAQLAAHCNETYYYHRHIISGKKHIPGCSYVFFPKSDRGPILANNLDSSPNEPFGPPGWPMVNEFLIMGGVSSGIFNDELSPEIFPAPVTRLVARYCRTTDEAVEMLKRYNYFWGPGNMLVADRNSNTAMIEKSACRIGVRKSPDGFGFITAMTAEEPAMKSYLANRRACSVSERKLAADCHDNIYWNMADKRRELMNELLDEARKNPTVETLRSFIQFRDPRRGLVCYNGEPLCKGGPNVEHTIKTSLWLLKEGRAMWWAYENGKASFENRKPDIEFEDVLAWQ